MLYRAFLALVISIPASLGQSGSSTVYGWGSNSRGQLGTGLVTGVLPPTVASALDRVVHVSAGEYQGMAVKSDGTLWVWGDNSDGRLGSALPQSFLPVPTQAQIAGTVIGMGSMYLHSAALTAEGDVYIWGSNAFGGSGDGNANPLSGIKARQIAVGRFHTLILDTAGKVFAYGGNSSGAVQYPASGGTSTYSTLGPVQVPGLPDVVEAVATAYHTNYALAQGRVWAWGYNANPGWLGDGSVTLPDRPVQLGAIDGVKALAVGDRFCLALKTDGTVWAWGMNAYGQLGNSTTTDSPIPVKVALPRKAVAIAAGAQHGLAVDDAGSVWAWGNNAKGQLGVPSSTYSFTHTPNSVPGLDHIVDVAGGYQFGLAVAKSVTDSTAPVIRANVIGSSPRNGWYSAPVSVEWEVSDPESGIQSSTCTRQDVTSDTPGKTISCEAVNGAGLSATGSVTIKLDKTAPQLDIPKSIAVDAASPAGVEVQYLKMIRATDNLTVPALSCTPKEGVFPIGSTSIDCAATDDAMNRTNGSSTIVVRGAADQAGNLLSYLLGLNLGQKDNGLSAKLGNAQSSLTGGNLANACAQLSAFENQVGAKSNKDLTAEQSAYLISSSVRIRQAAGCGK
ncbi:MAG: hypothetical protein HY821_23775 [Acidobacteria bacterium]|nr:hypothetical protein [Acidobacteriota bacterium]